MSGALRLAAVLAFLLALASAAAADDPVAVSASVDRDGITIGDPIVLSVVAEVDAGWRVTDPGVPRALGELEVIETLPALQARLAGDRTRFTFRYRVTAYVVGDHEIPGLELAYAGPDGAAGVARTPAIPIRVASVILPEEDASTIKALKPQLTLPGILARDLVRWAFAAAGAVAVVALGALAIWMLRRRRRPALDGLTPAQRALAELEALAALGYAEKGRFSEHYERMSEILRRYVADQYRLPAGERTPRELRVEMERAGVDPQQRAAIFEILREGETVRFRDGRSYPAHARNALGSALTAMKRAVAADVSAVAVEAGS